jgi:uncharacterized protein
MRTLFADTFYWAAMLHPRDDWHQRVREFNKTLNTVRLVTTEEVLSEFLNFFSAYDLRMRQGAFHRVQDILNSDSVQVIRQSHESFLLGIELYGQRPDKEFSLTDCVSMQTMRQLKLTEILTHDKHFSQEGFTILFS